MHDKTIGERIVLELSHSAEAYRTAYRFPFGYLWSHPTIAWAALREVMPWEALGVSLATFVFAFVWFGPDLGVAIGASVALGLVAMQMLRTRTYVTTSRIVRQRGLIPLRRVEKPLSDIVNGHVEYPVAGNRSFRDIVIATRAGDLRFRAVAEPESALAQIDAQRASGSRSA